jgi:hypothetical protein
MVFLAEMMLDDASNNASATPIHVYVNELVFSGAAVALCHRDIKNVWFVTVAEPQLSPLVLITILDTLCGTSTREPFTLYVKDEKVDELGVGGVPA